MRSRHLPQSFVIAFLILILWSLVAVPAARADEPSAPTKRSASPSTRSKVIDFDGDLVEGINRQPLDSLSQISRKNKRKNAPHLYLKRSGFRTEIQTTLREMRHPL